MSWKIAPSDNKDLATLNQSIMPLRSESHLQPQPMPNGFNTQGKRHVHSDPNDSECLP